MVTSMVLLVSSAPDQGELRQIGMLKLIGAPDRTIVAMIVPQALALGMSGFVSAPC